MRNLFSTTKRILAMAVITVLLFGSCKKFLDPQAVSVFSPDFIFQNVPYAKTAVLGAYSAMTGDAGYGIRLSLYYPYDTDEMLGAGGATQDNDRRDIARYNLTANNAQLAAPFNQLYAGIERANLCIYNIPKMTQYNLGTVAEQGELRRLLGESLTLRAQFYFELIRNWGDVPASFSPADQLPNLYLANADRDTVYTHIIADLLKAESLVPWRTDISKIGDVADARITLGTVKGLRARIALHRGGYSLRSDSHIMERRADYKTFYQIALYECTALLARRDQHTLNPSFRALWHDYVAGRNSNDPNGELMFQVAMGGANGQDSKIGTYDGDKFAGFGSASLSILPSYFYMFDSLDTRRDVTCEPYETNTDQVTRKGHPITTINNGKWRRVWWANPVNPTLASGNAEINWVILRFSDVLLMFAEADNEINGAPSAAAQAAVKEVSTRAHGGNATLVPPIPTDYTNFFKYLVRERMLEFGSEGIRKYDLIRWNLLTNAINETKANLANAGNTTQTAMVPFSYMASPPAYCLTATLPKSMFYITTSTADDSKIWANSFYKPAPAATPVGTTKVAWWANATVNSTFTTIFAYAFKTNHSELFPYQVNTLAADNFINQNFGY
jgi:hypothetical protein